MGIKELFAGWIKDRTSGENWNWVQDTAQKLRSSSNENSIFPVFGMAFRKLGKEALNLSHEELEEAGLQVEGFYPCHLTLDEAARIYFLLSLPTDDARHFSLLLDEILISSDMREALALHKSHSLLAHPEQHYHRAREAVRSNNKMYYEAVAHYNPYPFLNFEEDAWNQMVLKGLFVESNLYKIYGLEKRTNLKLKQMLIDYAKERWAAKRLVYPELWRCVCLLANEEDLPLFEKALTSPFPEERQGGALALKHCPLGQSEEIIKKYPFYLSLIENGTLNWENVNDPIL